MEGRLETTPCFPDRRTLEIGGPADGRLIKNGDGKMLGLGSWREERALLRDEDGIHEWE